MKYNTFNKCMRFKPGAYRQLLMVMKITAILTFAVLMQVSAAGLAQKVTLNERNASLSSVINKIRSQTGYDFIFNSKQVADAKPVNIHTKAEDLTSVLEKLFEGQNLEFTIKDRFIMLQPKEPSFLDNLVARFAIIDVRGKVVGENNEVLEGATVRVKGTGKMTKTNDKGEFYLSGVDAKAILEILFLGYKTREVKAGKELGVIRMEVFAGELEEVKVTYNTGYETIDKTRATGSFVKVDSALFNRSVSTNIIERLEGITPGLLFDRRPNSQGETSRTKLQIRGLSTLSTESLKDQMVLNNGSPEEPLIVVDNFPYTGDLNSLNPNDIEDITVLRDAAAASIWGARAGNGVVVITTKRAKFNQPQAISISSRVNIVGKPDLFNLPLMSASETIDLEKFLFQQGFFNNRINSKYRTLTPVTEILLKQRNSNGTITDNQVNAELDLLRQNDLRNDYLNHVYQTQAIQSYSANFNVGGRLSTTLLSIGYDNIPGISMENENNRGSFRVQNSFQPIKNLNIQTALSYSLQKGKQNGMSWGNLQYASRNIPLYMRLADDMGNPLAIYPNYRKDYTDALADPYLDWAFKPLEEIYLKENSTITKALTGSLNLSYNFVPELRATVSYQYDDNSIQTKNLAEIDLFSTRNLINAFTNFAETDIAKRFPIPKGGQFMSEDQSAIAHNVRAQLGYHKNWNNDNELSILAGAEFRDAKIDAVVMDQYGYDNQKNVIPIDMINTYPRQIFTGVTIFDKLSYTAPLSYRGLVNRFVAYYANTSYTYKQRYTVSASARKDASNIFGVNTNRKGRPFWSMGAAWKISNEPFYSSSAFPDLGLRASYGYSGNIDPLATAKTIVTYVSSALSTNGMPYATLSTSPNPDLRWEKVGTFNLALDFVMLNKRVHGSVDYYIKNSTDVITSETTDPTVGKSSIRTNSADMRGNGLDVMIAAKNIETSSFNWSSSLNYSHSTYKITKLKRIPERTAPGSGTALYRKEGYNPYQVISYRWAGLDLTGNPQYILNGRVTKNTDSAVFVEDTDLVFHGSALPLHFGNFLNTFSYKELTLSTNITYQFGYYFRRSSLNYTSLIDQGRGHKEYTQRWQKPGDENSTDVPSFVFPVIASRSGVYNNSSATVEKGDHLRINDVALSYRLTRPGIKLPFKQLIVTANLSNLNILIWRANKKGIDPIFQDNMKSAKSFAIGLNASL